MVHRDFCWFLEILMILTDSQIIVGDSQTILADSHDSQMIIMIIMILKWFSLILNDSHYSQFLAILKWESVRNAENQWESPRITKSHWELLKNHWKFF